MRRRSLPLFPQAEAIMPLGGGRQKRAPHAALPNEVSSALDSCGAATFVAKTRCMATIGDNDVSIVADTSTRLRPSSLARYSASSADFKTACGVFPDTGNAATPMEIVILG